MHERVQTPLGPGTIVGLVHKLHLVIALDNPPPDGETGTAQLISLINIRPEDLRPLPAEQP
jgi:hypothetical protein